MTYKAAIFDMDGTLIDSLADLADSANEMLDSFGFPAHTTEEYRWFVGNGARKLMERCLPKDRAKDAALVDEALERYKKIYEEKHLLTKTHPYDGIAEMLDALAAKNIPLGVCTNKPHHAALTLAAKLFPAGMFRAVVGDRKNSPRKPDPTNALTMAAEFGVAPESVAYFGDSGVDMQTAVNAGFLPVAVLWGFRPKDELAENGAKIFLSHPLEALEKINFL